ncbi:hypothetical protein BKA57DRAFT_215284 [Linnemannia elongata]|nr:hypothetical protein BKA57DRAFT_215284 [Linnemannia elongata]
MNKEAKNKKEQATYPMELFIHFESRLFHSRGRVCSVLVAACFLSISWHSILLFFFHYKDCSCLSLSLSLSLSLFPCLWFLMPSKRLRVPFVCLCVCVNKQQNERTISFPILDICASIDGGIQQRVCKARLGL